MPRFEYKIADEYGRELERQRVPTQLSAETQAADVGKRLKKQRARRKEDRRQREEPPPNGINRRRAADNRRKESGTGKLYAQVIEDGRVMSVTAL